MKKTIVQNWGEEDEEDELDEKGEKDKGVPNEQEQEEDDEQGGEDQEEEEVMVQEEEEEEEEEEVELNEMNSDDIVEMSDWNEGKFGKKKMAIYYW